MNVRHAGIAAAAVAVLGVAPTSGLAGSPAARPAAIGHFEGRVASIDRSARSFRLRDLERGTVRIRVTRRTRFERIAGFGGLRRGLLVEVTARGSGRSWVASVVERPGRRGGRGR